MLVWFYDTMVYKISVKLCYCLIIIRTIRVSVASYSFSSQPSHSIHMVQDVKQLKDWLACKVQCSGLYYPSLMSQWILRSKRLFPVAKAVLNITTGKKSQPEIMQHVWAWSSAITSISETERLFLSHFPANSSKSFRKHMSEQLSWRWSNELFHGISWKSFTPWKRCSVCPRTPQALLKVHNKHHLWSSFYKWMWILGKS